MSCWILAHFLSTAVDCRGQVMLLFWKLVQQTQTSKPLETTRHHNQNYWSFHPSELIYFALFTMRHPVGRLLARSAFIILTKYVVHSKGQVISEGHFDVIVLSKIWMKSVKYFVHISAIRWLQNILLRLPEL